MTFILHYIYELNPIEKCAHHLLHHYNISGVVAPMCTNTNTHTVFNHNLKATLHTHHLLCRARTCHMPRVCVCFQAKPARARAHTKGEDITII